MSKRIKNQPASASAAETAATPNENCACLDLGTRLCGNIDVTHCAQPCRGADCPDQVPFDEEDEPKHAAPERKAPRKAPRKAAAQAAEPEIVPAQSAALELLKRPESQPYIERLEESIQRDIIASARIDKAGAMVGVKIGLALQAAKALIRHGQYEGWVASKFGDAFGTRKAQYFSKLALVFLKTERSVPLELPAPEEAGKWLAIADEVHPLARAIEEFVGDRTLAELLDQHNVRPVRQKRGGWRPAAWLVRQYQDEHPELRNIEFELWTPAQREAFRTWQDTKTQEDEVAPRRIAAEATWENLRATLADHGISRTSWKLLTAEQLGKIHDVLATVTRDIGRAIKHPETLEA